MLTKEQYDFLSAPYPVEDIEFLRGFAYVRERAINIRLSEIDPSWDYRIVSYEYRSPIHVVCMVEIKFAEIVRGGIGEQKNEGNNPKELDVAKGAETDAFKRAARKFGVGLYLTELPDYVKDETTYKAWYQRQPHNAPKPSQNGEISILEPQGDVTTTDYEKEALAWLKKNNSSIVYMMRDLHLNSGHMPSKDDKEGWSGLLNRYREFLKTKAAS